VAEHIFGNHDTVWKVWVDTSSLRGGGQTSSSVFPNRSRRSSFAENPGGLCGGGHSVAITPWKPFSVTWTEFLRVKPGTEEEHPLSLLSLAKTLGKILYYNRVSGKRIDYPLNKPQVLISVLLHT
jgi:hypothetical protein